MTVFNYGFANDITTYIKIEEDTLKCKFSKVTDVVFRNYPMLRIDDVQCVIKKRNQRALQKKCGFK